jgi:hypothetical protein
LYFVDLLNRKRLTFLQSVRFLPGSLGLAAASPHLHDSPRLPGYLPLPFSISLSPLIFLQFLIQRVSSLDLLFILPLFRLSPLGLFFWLRFELVVLILFLSVELPPFDGLEFDIFAGLRVFVEVLVETDSILEGFAVVARHFSAVQLWSLPFVVVFSLAVFVSFFGIGRIVLLVFLVLIVLVVFLTLSSIFPLLRVFVLLIQILSLNTVDPVFEFDWSFTHMILSIMQLLPASL